MTANYRPATGDRILITRIPGNHGRRQAVMTGTVLEVFNDGGLHFKNDAGGRAYLGSDAQLAAIGVTQTIEPAPDTP